MAKVQTPQKPSLNGDKALLNKWQKNSFHYFVRECNPANGLVADSTAESCPASVATIGFALSIYPVGVERGWMEREEALERTLTTLRFFWDSPQGKAPDATGYKGFYYHFLDSQTGRRRKVSELSTIDTTLLIAGALLAAQYFNQETEDEEEIRTLADKLYRRIDWQWATNGKATVCLGWKPESGFLKDHWEGYSESMLLYLLALGSPTSPLPPESYQAVMSDYKWKRIYGRDLLYAGPLFIHQYSHIWIDFRDIQDDFMREKGSDYFKNSQDATFIQQEYAIRNPREYVGYDEFQWGITASEGPGSHRMKIDGVERVFFDYKARGAPYGPDDGTVAPWVAATSLPFVPQIVLPTIRHFDNLSLPDKNPHRYKATFNQTFPEKNQEYGWVSECHYGVNQGPLVLMIENYQTEMLWKLMQQCPYLIKGLQRAGFKGGWLE